MSQINKAIALSILGLIFVASTANAQSRPKLYPSKKLNSMTTGEVNDAIAACESQARSDVGVGNGDAATGNAVRGAAKGAAAGALVGAITKGKVGRTTAAGAAVGGGAATLGNVRARREGSPEYRNYVSACLEEKGLKVVGWN